MYHSAASFGSDVARVLAGSWRRPVECLPFPWLGFETCIDLLLTTGAGPLGWRRFSLDSTSDTLNRLRDDYRRHAAETILHEHALKDIFRRTQKMGLEVILFKGWALARLYPDPALRPYGDIDLWVRADGLKNLYRAVRSGDDYPVCVEPHVSFYQQYERTLDDVMDRSKISRLDEVEIRIPADEDHLRFICLHFLFHGGWRPLWLCDVALMVESAGTSFDWDRCLRGKRKHADWVLCVIGLAHQLLGANIKGTPAEERAKTLPRWLTSGVLRQWGKGPGMSFAENLSFSVPRRLLKPAALAHAFREHWRNPIQASVEMNAWFNESPRALLQFSSVFLRIPEFVRYFGREIQRT